MRVGRHAAAEPRSPLWIYVVGCQGLDVVWSLFVIAGVETFRVDPTLPGSPLDRYCMPLTQSLPAVVSLAFDRPRMRV